MTDTYIPMSAASLRLVWMRPAVTAQQAMVVVEQLVANLSERQRQQVNIGSLDLIGTTDGGTRAGAHAVSQELHEADQVGNEDMSLAFMWVAACMGDWEAEEGLAYALSREALKPTARVAPERAQALAGFWLLRSHESQARRAQRRSRLDKLAADTAAKNTAAKAAENSLNPIKALADLFPDAVPPTPAKGASAKVLSEIGDPDNKGTTDLLKRFGHLAEPLPLLGGDRDFVAVGRKLKAVYPWMASVIQHLVNRLRLGELEGHRGAYLKPILLVGQPGCGKSDFLPILGELLGLKVRVIPCAGMTSSMSIEGTARGYITATPGLVASTCAQLKTANPMIVFDELEKAGTGTVNGNVHDALMPLLEASTAKALFDPCLLGDVDATHVSFVGTANETVRLPRPLVDRFDILEVPAPGPEHLEAILGSMRLRDAAKVGKRVEELPQLAEHEVDWLRGVLRESGSLRQLRKAYGLVQAQWLDADGAAPSGPLH